MLTLKEIDFINTNKDISIDKLSLIKNRPRDINFNLCINSIGARNKMSKKVPVWCNNDSILEYPYPLSIEQCSSQATAMFKAKIISQIKKESLVADITGGMGVDSYFISKNVKQLLYLERDPALCSAATYNFPALDATNIEVKNINSDNNTLPHTLLAFACKHGAEKLDLIFADPARRGKNNSKVVKLEDYEPNILELKEHLLSIANFLLIKVSPMADIKMYLSKLENVKKVYVVSVDNECKEILFLLNKETNIPITNIEISAINIKLSYIDKNYIIENINLPLSVTYSFENDLVINYSTDEYNYIYEPNKSILKSNAFKTVSHIYNVDKISPNTNLYTSNLIKEFPGKTFKVLEIYPFAKKNFKEIAKKYPAASVTARNLPIDSDQLRKQLAIKEDDRIHIFAFTNNLGKKLLVISERIN